jgi:CTP:molybdopterin cytidylyltransferase MocA
LRDQRLVAALAPGECVEVEAPDMGAIFDIDTPDDLAAAWRF